VSLARGPTPKAGRALKVKGNIKTFRFAKNATKHLKNRIFLLNYITKILLIN
jgi:hypothetical protein